MTNDLHDKYERLIAAGMPGVDGLKYWAYSKKVHSPEHMSFQRAEDLITMQAMRWAEIVHAAFGNTDEWYVWSAKVEDMGEAPTIIDAILDAVERTKEQK